MFKAGFVNIIGKPNVGKSTLLNIILGEKLAIISPKSQTTRHRIRAFYTQQNYQIIFSDTPGLLDPKYKLHEAMLDAINEAFEDADILLYLTTIEEKPEYSSLPSKVSEINVPLIIAINKIDLAENQEIVNQFVQQWQSLFINANIIPISAKYNFNTDVLLNKIVELLPEHPPYFDTDDISDRNLRFFVSELIREKIFLNYKQEIPYSSEVVIDRFLEEEDIVKIYATIYVERESQKAIIIGKSGKAIKELGIAARIDIEQFLNKKVFLDLSVKVLKNWRNDPKILKRLGYLNKD